MASGGGGTCASGGNARWRPRVRGASRAVVASGSMLGRLLSLVLGLAVVAFIAYWAVNNVAGMAKVDPEAKSQPKAVLDRTREATKRMEQDT